MPSEKSLANLKRDAGPGRPKKTAAIAKLQQFAQELVTDPAYRRKFWNDWRDRKIHPSIEALMWYYTMGKPKETIEQTGGPATIQIIHQLRRDPPALPAVVEDDEPA